MPAPDLAKMAIDMSVDERWITYRGAVDAWECDQMQHMNIQYFARRVSLAERYFLAGLGLSRPVLDRSGYRVNIAREQLRFSKELRAGSPIVGRSIPVRIGGDNELHLKHQLLNGLSGDICMTASSEYRLVADSGESIAWPARLADAIDGSEAVDRSQPAGPALESHASLKECGRHIVCEEDCRDGEFTREALVRLINHAGSHVGLEQGRQRNDDGRLRVGSATLSLRIERHAAIIPGMLLSIVSGIEPGARKIVHVMHYVSDAGSGVEVATVRAAHVFFDVASRKAIEMPERVTRPPPERSTPAAAT
jgi:acyl-CoA thioester hydrolase